MTSNPNNVPTWTDENIFGRIFGKQTCVNPWANFWMYVLLAVVLTLVFALMAYIPWDRYMESYIVNPNGRFGLKVVLFFLVAWLLVFLFGMWFQTHPSCTEK